MQAPAAAEGTGLGRRLLGAGAWHRGGLSPDEQSRQPRNELHTYLDSAA